MRVRPSRQTRPFYTSRRIGAEQIVNDCHLTQFIRVYGCVSFMCLLRRFAQCLQFVREHLNLYRSMTPMQSGDCASASVFCNSMPARRIDTILSKVVIQMP
jgi:hypothetical protein